MKRFGRRFSGRGARRSQRQLIRRVGKSPVVLRAGVRSRAVLVARREYDRLRALDAGAATNTLSDPVVPTAPNREGHRVLCRIDAYADYVALVKADNAIDAAQVASDYHEEFVWEPHGTTEFDERLYVTLDGDGDEIENTEIRDF